MPKYDSCHVFEPLVSLFSFASYLKKRLQTFFICIQGKAGRDLVGGEPGETGARGDRGRDNIRDLGL